MKESDIVYESEQGIWVGKEKVHGKIIYSVFVDGVTHSITDSTYNEESLAVARAEYLVKRRPTRNDVIKLHDNINRFNSITTG